MDRDAAGAGRCAPIVPDQRSDAPALPGYGSSAQAVRVLGRPRSRPLQRCNRKGFRAQAAPGEVVVDHEELEDARWFPREDVTRIRKLGLRLPFRGTIARALIEDWLAETAGAR